MLFCVMPDCGHVATVGVLPVLTETLSDDGRRSYVHALAVARPLYLCACHLDQKFLNLMDAYFGPHNEGRSPNNAALS